jgi:hypothetical protein
MRDLFPGYYAPEDFQQLWNEGTFVLDANVLLNLYRFPKSAAEDLLRVLGKVSSRLWLPHQAALEYQVNRLKVILEQREQFKNVKKALKGAMDGLQNEFNTLQLKKRHSSIDPDPFLVETRKLFDEFEKKLDQLEKAQPDVSDRDEIRDRIDKLLLGKVGAPPKSQTELDQIYSDGKKRYQDRRPPGYKDKDKGRDSASSAYFVNNLRFEREYGDVVLWRQILDHAKQEQLQHLILIIDDNKEDWWQSIGGKKIGPQPELIGELTSETGVKTFHMYTSERFLEFAQVYIQEEVRQTSIDQIRDVIEANKVQSFSDQLKSDFFREEAVRSWLEPCPDPFIYSTLKENVQRANKEIADGKFDTFVVIFVLSDESFASELRETIQWMPDVHGPCISFIISTIVRRTDGSGKQRALLNILHEFL